ATCARMDDWWPFAVGITLHLCRHHGGRERLIAGATLTRTAVLMDQSPDPPAAAATAGWGGHMTTWALTSRGAASTPASAEATIVQSGAFDIELLYGRNTSRTYHGNTATLASCSAPSNSGLSSDIVTRN